MSDEQQNNDDINLQLLSGLVTSGKLQNIEEQTEQIANEIDRIISDHKKQFEIFLIALCRKRIGRMQKLLTFLENAEDEIFTTERLGDASTAEILRMINMTNLQVTQIMNFVKDTIDLNVVGDVGDLNLNIFQGDLSRGKNVGMSASERENIRSIFSSMLKRVNKE